VVLIPTYFDSIISDTNLPNSNLGGKSLLTSKIQVFRDMAT